jgi:hypothetical protein
MTESAKHGYSEEVRQIRVGGNFLFIYPLCLVLLLSHTRVI